MNTTESNPITGPGIVWAKQQIWAHFDKVAAKLDEKKVAEIQDEADEAALRADKEPS